MNDIIRPKVNHTTVICLDITIYGNKRIYYLKNILGWQIQITFEPWNSIYVYGASMYDWMRFFPLPHVYLRVFYLAIILAIIPYCH